MTDLRQIQTRGGTAAQFASSNPVLLAREEVIETDTGRRKIGDGTTRYNALPYQQDPDLVAALATETATRAAAVTAETARATAAETAIAGNVTAQAAANARRTKTQRLLSGLNAAPTIGLGLGNAYPITSDAPLLSHGTVNTITTSPDDTYGIETVETRWTPVGSNTFTWDTTYGFLANWTNGLDGAPICSSFMLTGTTVEITWRAGTSSEYQWVWVDGKPISVAPIVPAGLTVSAGSIYLTKLTFPTAGVRRIDFRSLYGALVKIRTQFGQSTIGPVPARRGNGRIFCLGDSLLGGSALQGPMQTWGWKIGMACGFEYFHGGQGGTGYVASGTGGTGAAALTDSSRLDPVVAADPDAVLIYIGGNDTLTPPATVGAAAAQTYAYLNARIPNVPVIVAGTYASNAADSLSAARAAVNKAIRDACVAAPNVIGFIDPVGTARTGTAPPTFTNGATYNVGDLFSYQGGLYRTYVQHTAGATPSGNYTNLASWLFGTGNATSPAGNGNRDILLSFDGVHPTALGAPSIAQRIMQGAEKIAAGYLSGATFTDA